MIDYEKIVRTIVTPLIFHPDALMIRVIRKNDDNSVTIMVIAEDDDTARLIGKHGNIANALREIVAIPGKSVNDRIHLQFESFDVDEKE